MQIVRQEDAKHHDNDKSCLALEYPMEEEAINGAVIHLKGRYPKVGQVTNLQCRELVYVMEGSGKLIVAGHETFLSEGDMVLISPHEVYFWEGNLTLFIASTPAWTPDQHRHLT